MAAQALQITVDDRVVRRVFERAPAAATTRIRQLVESGAIDVQRQMMMRATSNVGVTGDYRRSIRYTVSPASLSAEIGPHVPYAEPLENGSRPHWVSVKPGSSLRKWADLKGINPYALQHSIAAKGTKAHPIVTETYQLMKPQVERQIARGLAQFVEELSNGSI